MSVDFLFRLFQFYVQDIFRYSCFQGEPVQINLRFNRGLQRRENVHRFLEKSGLLLRQFQLIFASRLIEAVFDMIAGPFEQEFKALAAEFADIFIRVFGRGHVDNTHLQPGGI